MSYLQTSIVNSILRRLPGAMLPLVVASALFVAHAHAQAADREARFNIPAQDLTAAIIKFSDQSGLQVVTADAQLNGLNTKGVNGLLKINNALDKLLLGTGLKYRMIGKTAVVLIPIEQKTTAGDEMTPEMRLAWTDMAAMVADTAGGDVADRKKDTAKNNDVEEMIVEEMIVEEGRIRPFTGSNVDIPRTINDPQPYYIFDSQTIERSAAANVEDFLKQRLTMNTVMRTNSQDVGAFGGNSASQFNLRGLGTDKTLVLINGRRVSGIGGDGGGQRDLSQPDLNGYPLSAIERIEVLPSSASGIYGGSALGGVINVILKRDYNGGEVRATYNNSWDTDSAKRTLGATYGLNLNEGKTQMMLSAAWSDSNGLVIGDRRELLDRGIANIVKNSRDFIYSATVPFPGSLPNIVPRLTTQTNLTLRNGTVLPFRNTYVPAGTQSGTSMSTLYTGLSANAGSFNLALPPTYQAPNGLNAPVSVVPTTKSVMTSLTQRLTDRLSGMFDWTHSENSSFYVTAPQNYSASITVLAASPVNPFNHDVLVNAPLGVAVPIGNRNTTDTMSLGLNGKWSHGWVTYADYTVSRNRSKSNRNNLNYDLFNAAIASGEVNPFVDTLAYPYDISRYFAYTNGYFSTTSQSFALRGSGQFLRLPWGVPNLTVGADHRTSKIPGGEYSSFDLKVTYYERRQQTTGLYAEAAIPLVRQAAVPLIHALELQLSGRTDRYVVNTGTRSHSINPRLASPTLSFDGPTLNGVPIKSQATYASANNTVAIKYNPIPQLTMRMSTATAFVPPTPDQLIKNPLVNTSLTTVVDPKNGNSSIAVQTISGGNPDLTPQDSKSLNAGIIWEPSVPVLAGLRMNIEYYRTSQFNAIGSLAAQAIVTDEALYAGRVTRDSSGRIALVDTSLLNLYKRETAGWDVSFDYRRKTRIGTLAIQAVESGIQNLRTQYSLLLPEYDAVNFPSEGGAIKYKSNLSVSWESGNWSASWTSMYFGAYKQSGAEGGPDANRRRATNPSAALSTTYTAAQGSDRIPSQLYHDLYIGYVFDRSKQRGTAALSLGRELLSGTTLQLGVKNVFNTLPPFDVFYRYYSSPTADVRLRSYWLSLKKQF